VGKGLPGFGIERAPSREGVSALDHQATPAALQALSIRIHRWTHIPRYYFFFLSAVKTYIKMARSGVSGKGVKTSRCFTIPKDTVQFKYQCLFFPWWYAKHVQHDKDRPGKEQTKWVWWWKMLGLRGLECAPSSAGVERRTSRPHRRPKDTIPLNDSQCTKLLTIFDNLRTDIKITLILLRKKKRHLRTTVDSLIVIQYCCRIIVK
jgi:hypothetical protein